MERAMAEKTTLRITILTNTRAKSGKKKNSLKQSILKAELCNDRVYLCFTIRGSFTHSQLNLQQSADEVNDQN